MSFCGNGRTSLFTGMSQAQLKAQLAVLQQAYLDLMTGNKGESFTYTQGDGSKSVVYTRANIAALSQLISELQYLTGNCCARRRPIRFLYR